MFAWIATIAAAAALHLGAPSPIAELAAVEKAAPFHVLTLFGSAQLLRADVLREGAAVTGARLVYSVEGKEIVVTERLPDVDDAPPGVDPQGEVFNLVGYSAVFQESGNEYRHEGALTWYRPDLTVRISSRDRVSAPLLLDIGLELR